MRIRVFGIAPEDLDHIFERFYRIEDQRVPKTSGTGIGLDICRQIIEAHEGKIKAESELYKGTRFIITLPTLL